MKGGEYEKEKDGMNIIAEAMTKLQFEAFKTTEEYKQLQESLDIDQDVIQVMNNLYQSSDDHGKEFGQALAQAKVSLHELQTAFEYFQISAECNENFLYWNIFLKEISLQYGTLNFR